MNHDWCEVDDCPSIICNGPHYRHICVDGSFVDGCAGLLCPWCGHELGTPDHIGESRTQP